MSKLRAFFLRLGGSFRKREDELSAEIESHLQHHIEDNVRVGMTPQQARRDALMRLGGVEVAKEAYRDRRGIPVIEHLMQDLRYGVRQLRRSPGFTVVAVLSLALGIGANTAIFTLLDQVLLRSLPVKDPQSLAVLRWQGTRGVPSVGTGTLPYPYYREIRDHGQAFDGVLGQFPVELSLSHSGQTEHIEGELVSGNYFEVLGVSAALGRTFGPEDDAQGGTHSLAVLTYDFWVDKFGGDPNVLGQIILVNNVSLTVIGVSAKGFDGMDLARGAKIRIPLSMMKQMSGFFGPIWNLENRRSAWVEVFARLKHGVTREQAQASVAPLFRSMLEADAQDGAFIGDTEQARTYARQKFRETSLQVWLGARGYSRMRAQYDTPLRILMALVVLVLLMAALNVANLLLARGAARRREVAVRLALGADRWRLIRQSLAESALLTVLGGAAGVALAMWADRLLIALIPAGDDHLQLNTAPDLRILAFTLFVSAAAGLLFGLLPAWSAARLDIFTAVREHARSNAGNPRMRRVLVVAQVFLSTLLFIAAGSFVRSLENLRTLDTGFRAEQVDTFLIAADLNGYRHARAAQYYRQLVARVRAVPGVTKAAVSSMAVLDGWWGQPVTIDGYAAAPGESMLQASNMVTPDYFAALGVPFIEGRDFQPSDATSGRGVAIVNQTFARKYFGNRSALGHMVAPFEQGVMAKVEIVGVVKDSRYEMLRDAPPSQLFLDFEQHDDPFGHFVVVKTKVGAQAMFAALREAVRSIDPNVPVFAMRTLDEQIDRNIATDRLVAGLAAGFGIVAAVLAAVGLYGLMAFNVARRTAEIGVRVALGARRGAVAWMVVRDVLTLVGVGAVVALPAAWALSRYLQSQLYGVKAGDPVTVAGMAVALGVVAAVAGFVPARRAVGIDPMVALRHE